jgi:hypothetical protein
LPPNSWLPSFLDMPPFSSAGSPSWPSSFRDGQLTRSSFLLSGILGRLSFIFEWRLSLYGGYQTIHHLFHFFSFCIMAI